MLSNETTARAHIAAKAIVDAVVEYEAFDRDDLQRVIRDCFGETATLSVPHEELKRRLLEAKARKAILDYLHAISGDSFAIGTADDRIQTILDKVRCPDVPERARRYDAVRTAREAGNPFWEDAVRKYPGRRSEILAIDRLIVEVAGEERVRRDTGVLPGWIVCGQKWAITTSLKCDPGDVADAVSAVLRDNGYEPGRPTGLGPLSSRGRAA